MYFGRENDKGLKLVPYREDEPVCYDEPLFLGSPYCYFYTTIFKKVLLRLPMYNFEKALLTEIHVAPAQLHSNSWAFVRGFPVFAPTSAIYRS